MNTLAAYSTALGPAECIEVGQLPVPAPGPTDVLVRTEALAVDQVDTLVRSGAYRTPTPFPFIIGRDLAGTVAASGPGAVGFAEGDQVWCNRLGHGGRQGSFAQHVVAAAERLCHLPPASIRPGPWRFCRPLACACRAPPWPRAALATCFGQPVMERAGSGNRVVGQLLAAGTFPARPASTAGANTRAGGACPARPRDPVTHADRAVQGSPIARG
jgi:hypothetical protein